MPKAPFERIFSLVERKKILQRVVRDRIPVMLKVGSGVFTLKPLSLDANFGVQGVCSEDSLKDFEKVTALFYVDKDRYFLTTRLKKKDHIYTLLNDAQFFKLNRRNAFRIHLPPRLGVYFVTTSVRNIEVKRKMTVLEFSSGGAKLYWPNETKLAKGTILKGLLQWENGKILSLDCSVVHAPEAGIYGVRFVNLSTASQNRLKMLSIEFQRSIYLK